jgi:hypothetical protein
MVMSPAGLRPENDPGGEDQQQSERAPHVNKPALYDSNKNLILGPR